MSNKPADSKMNTVVVPAVGTDPALLYAAAERVLRVVVRNVGGNGVFLSHEASVLLTNQGLAGTFQLPAGAETTVVLMPRQSLVAGGAGPNGVVSIAVSEAIPITWSEA